MKTVIFFLGLCCFVTFLHAQLKIDFSNGNFQGWNGDSSKFVVVNAALQLMDNNPGSTNQAYLSTLVPVSSSSAASWEFYVKLAFSPSTTNFSRIYLTSSQNALTRALNGYFVQIGGINGNLDAVQLCRQDGTNTVVLLNGRAGGAASDPVALRVRVKRNAAGTWSLEVDYNGGRDFEAEGTILDQTYPTHKNFGWYCQYTASRNKAFLLDDLRVDTFSNDRAAPVLLKADVVDAQNILLEFDEALDIVTAEDASRYDLKPGPGKVVDAMLNLNNLRVVALSLDRPLQNLQNYLCTVNGIQDLAGNLALPQSMKFTYINVENPVEGDLLINETLFNAGTGGSEFVELYNKSQKVINLHGILLINRQKNSGGIQSTITEDYLLLPGQYVAIAESKVTIRKRYMVKDSLTLINNPLPTLDDAAGNITLRYNNITLDSFNYSKDLHSPLLTEEAGVSLERLSVDLPTNSPGNWHSAASSVGGATPGYANSQTFKPGSAPTDEVFHLDEVKFSPDGDGFQDILLLPYQTKAPGFLANIIVFDINGRPIKRLARNESLASEGILKWDGTTDELLKARVGIYVIWVELFEPGGGKSVQKLSCVLAGYL